MMANPLPIVVPDLDNSYKLQELDEVKIQQPLPTPRPCATYDVLVPCAKLLEQEAQQKDLLQNIVFLQSEPHPDCKPITEQPSKLDTLDDLETVERIMCTRRLHVKNALIMKGAKNTFFIRTPDQKLIYTIDEENSWWVGYCLNGLRPLTLKVKNADGVEVIRMKRPYAFTTRVLPCQLQSMQVFSPPDNPIGSITQRWTALRPHYIIKDLNGQILFEIHGPRITISCFKDVSFLIKRPDGTLVATTNKRWEGLFYALFISPVVDKFSLSFMEKSLGADEKALLLATSLLLDYMYYDI